MTARTTGPAPAARVALVMAGGTGGHIFPALAVAQTLRERGWTVHWLGQSSAMEGRLIPAQGFAFESIEFSGLRGKGAVALALLPLRLLKACWQSVGVLRRVRPAVVVGFGGYITFPAGLMAALMGKPLVLHEQNAVAGMVNRVLARVADRVFTAFPGVMRKGQWIGNPLRQDFLGQPGPAQRLGERSGPLRLLVVGGSLGAQALNERVPQALALMAPEQRPVVVHQSGERQMEALRTHYAHAGVVAELRPFIDNIAIEMAQADLLICRAGASTVTEIAALGVASVLVPFPFAVDDHQTANARFLSQAGAATLLPQSDLTPAVLAEIIQKTERTMLIDIALKAKNMAKTNASHDMANACEALTS
jgi:UDP-N-acetylglucosamine--N-acetylmuramyl-(pentapeptide) pyrophosphoryl-undecaprenol N-acetylglucosamine transferase